MRNRTSIYSKLFFVLLTMTFMQQVLADEASEVNEFAGDKKCNTCHKDKVADLDSNIHSKMAYWNEETTVCESCHGPAKAHTKDRRNPDKILNPAKVNADLANEQCLGCHENSRNQQYWAGSPHQQVDVTCVSCHSVHDSGHREAMLSKESISETCYDCHSEQRSYTLKRSSHPLRDQSRADGLGKMECTNCHNPHGTQTENLISANSVNDKCYECHQEMKAPVLWEHSAVKESCLNCHNAHGSNNEMMLTAKQPRLCQQCHEQGRHQTLAGEPNSFFVTNRGCSNCHAQIHGSNHPGGVKIKR